MKNNSYAYTHDLELRRSLKTGRRETIYVEGPMHVHSTSALLEENVELIHVCAILNVSWKCFRLRCTPKVRCELAMGFVSFMLHQS